MSLTVDASVFVASARPGELTHRDSLHFVDRIDRDVIALRCPSIVLPESAAAMGRVTGSTQAADDLSFVIETLPGMSLVPLTVARAREAATTGVRFRLRGADAIYVQTALEASTVLITWDREMLTRASIAVQVLTPTQWLASNPDPASAP